MRRKKSSEDPRGTKKHLEESSRTTPDTTATTTKSNPPVAQQTIHAVRARRKRNAGGLWWSFLTTSAQDPRHRSIQRIEYPHLHPSRAARRQQIQEHVLNVVMVTVVCLVIATMGIFVYTTSDDNSLRSKKLLFTALQSGTPRRGKPALPRISLPGLFQSKVKFRHTRQRHVFVSFTQRINFFRSPVFARMSTMQYPFFYFDDDAFDDDESGYMDFGGIDIKFLDADGLSRQIYHELSEFDGQNYRSLKHETDDDVVGYYNFDDDFLRNPYLLFDDDVIGKQRHCRRTNWHRLNFPTCNSMHELDLSNQWFSFVGDGAYREVFLTKQNYLNVTEEVIFKELLWDREHEYEDYESIRMDALVTERMTTNPLIVDLYSYCGISMLTEYFSNGDIEDDIVSDYNRRKGFKPHEEPELTPRNNYTGSEKLKLALAMAQPIADLHNFEGGVIVHDDVQLVQYLWTDSTKTNIKLNDFNRAEIMLWDEENQEYCGYKNGEGMGDWRAPEEYRDRPLSEKIDTWSLGNNFYSLLTGHYPFMDTPTTAKVQKRIKRGDVPVVDKRYSARSFGESILVEIIKRCYVYDAKRRADINEIVEKLQEAIVEDDRRREAGEVEWGEENVPKEDSPAHEDESPPQVDHPESDSTSEDDDD